MNRSNDILFLDNSVSAHAYSGFPASHVVSLVTMVTEDSEHDAYIEDSNEYEEGYYDDEDDSMVRNDIVVANVDVYYDTENPLEDPGEQDNSEECTVVGTVSKVEIIPPGVMQNRKKRWKKAKARHAEVDEQLIQTLPGSMCSVCCRIFQSTKRKDLHVCKGSKDPQDMISFSILEAERLIRSGEVNFIQKTAAIQEEAIVDATYVPFEAGWAIRPKIGDLYGKKYIEKYSAEIVQMFQDGFVDKSRRRGPNRMREELIRRHPGAFDIPSEAEIRSAISRMMLQAKTGR